MTVQFNLKPALPMGDLREERTKPGKIQLNSPRPTSLTPQKNAPNYGIWIVLSAKY